MTAMKLDELVFNDETLTYARIGFFEDERPFTPFEVIDSVANKSIRHVPLYFVITSLWARLVGFDPIVLRVLSWFCGLLAIAWTYRLGRDVIAKQAGLAAAFLIAASGYFQFYMHELRMYTMMTLLTAIVMGLYWQIVHTRHQPGYRLWVGLFASMAALLYTHYFGLFVLLGIGVYHGLAFRRIQRWWSVSAVMLAAGLSFAPWLTHIGKAINKPTPEDIVTTAMPVDRLLYNLSYLFSNGLIPVYVSLLILVIYLAVAKKQQRFFYFLVVGLVVVLAIAVSNEFVSILRRHRMRYTLILWPIMAAGIGAGLTQFFRQQRLILLLLAAGWLIASFQIIPSQDLSIFESRSKWYFDRYPDFEHLLDMFDAHHLSDFDTPLITVHYSVIPNEQTLQYYQQALGRPLWHVTEQAVISGDGQRQAAINLEPGESFWLAYSPPVNPQLLPIYQEQLAANHHACHMIEESGITLEYYAPSSLPCEDIPKFN